MVEEINNRVRIIIIGKDGLLFYISTYDINTDIFPQLNFYIYITFIRNEQHGGLVVSTIMS